MQYQWDQHKATSNQKKHGIRFADAVTVFADELAIRIEDPYPDEERYVMIGQDALGRVLVVIFTYRGDDIRVISARKANVLERQAYENEL